MTPVQNSQKIMEIKYTIEILTKDIQDIEKLVGNLQNSKDNSALEIDLALSKLRNVYEILTIIKADRLHELVSQPQVEELLSVETTQPAKPEAIAVPEPEPQTITEVVPEPPPISETIPAPQPVSETIPEPQPITEIVPEPPPVSATVTSDPSILAEKFTKESSINENLAEKRKVDLDTKLIGQPIDNISRNIGINDRFFIIRELFKGNSDQFSILVNRLDTAENYLDAERILKEHFSESLDQEGVLILTGLVKRRHIR